MQVVIYDQNSTLHSKWSEQFVAADKLNRKRRGMNGNQSRASLVKVIVDAASDAKGGGRIIFAVGHGGVNEEAVAAGLIDGMVDLAPNHKLRLAAGGANTWVNPFYDWVFVRPGMKPSSDMSTDQNIHPTGEKDRLANWQLYQSIGAAMRTNNVREVTFLTCRIGKSLNFIKKIAKDWDVLVHAYTKYIWFGGDDSGKIRVYLDGDKDGQGTNVPDAATQIPQANKTSGDFVTVGPPLAAAAAH